MKEPGSASTSSKGGFVKSTRTGHRAGRRAGRRIHKGRLALLGVGLSFVVSLALLSGWALFTGLQHFSLLSAEAADTAPSQSTRDVASNNSPLDWIASHPAAADTSHFEAMMRQDFALDNQPSLLYFNPMDSWSTLTLARDAGRDFMANSLSSAPRLLPIVDVAEDIALKTKLESLFAEYPRGRFSPHLYLYNPQNRSYVSIDGYSPVPAASVIKLPILLEYLTHLDQRDMSPDMPLFYGDIHRTGGAGELQYKPSGVELLANDVAGQMIRISDNTCTNMMIDYLGGTNAVNRQLSHLGLTRTRVRNWLPDLGGTNTISPYEMTTILYNLDDQNVVSAAARENGLQILKSTHNRRLLVTPLPSDAIVAHKTGDIGTSLGDSGIIYMPDGRKYIISIQVERPYNDYTARDIVQRASRLVYDHVAKTTVSPIFANAQPQTAVDGDFSSSSQSSQ